MSNFDQSKKFDVTKDYLITNPRELIHQYATTTPVSVLEIPETTTRTTTKMSRTTTEETLVIIIISTLSIVMFFQYLLDNIISLSKHCERFSFAE